jgi:hypothetical protein
VVAVRGLLWFLLIVATGLPPQVAVADDETTLNWSVTPYLWASQTRLSLELNDQKLGGDTISFNDLLDQLDTAFMVNIEAGKGRWSAFADLTYLQTSDKQQRPVFRVESRSDSTLLDTGVAFWPHGVGSDLSIIAGLRFSGFDNRYRFFVQDIEVSRTRDDDDYYDALLGLRYRFEIGERWALLTHADFSLGQSEGTWLLRANLARTVGRSGLNRILFGYQYKHAEYKSGELRTKYSYNGPMAGFNFRF